MGPGLERRIAEVALKTQKNVVPSLLNRLTDELRKWGAESHVWDPMPHTEQVTSTVFCLVQLINQPLHC